MKIEKLEIFTRRVQEQLKFYRDVLELEIQEHNEKSFEVVAGYSVLRFIEKENAAPYHIAFHIPDKQEEEALTWLKERVSILKHNSDEIIDFSNWSAKSMYFYDADKNIMEFISRANLNKPKSAIFSEESIVGIAEIGLATKDIKEKFHFLQKNCELEIFDGSFDKFCAIGDDHGLLITINKDLKDWFPTNDTAFVSDFKLSFSHNNKSYKIIFQNDRLSLE